MAEFASSYSLCGLIVPRDASRFFRDEPKPSTHKKRRRFVTDDQRYHTARDDAFNGTASAKQLAYLQGKENICKNKFNTALITQRAKTAANRKGNAIGETKKQKGGEESRSSAKSGDGNSADDPDPEPERNRKPYNQQSLSSLLCIIAHPSLRNGDAK